MRMHLHKFEKIWLSFGVFALVMFLSIVGVSAFGQGNHPSGGMQTIDPENVEATPPFDNPGVHQLENGTYEAVIIAQAFGYTPTQMEVPVGEEVTFKVTSSDVVHSFSIVDTNVNMMAVPGQINEKTYTFEEPGNYLIICNEYCGSGHHMMQTSIEVVE